MTLISRSVILLTKTIIGLKIENKNVKKINYE